MSEYEHGVFVSYAWGGESEEIVNQIDQALQTRGIEMTRDKRDVDYKDSISQFMERLGRGDCVVVVISDRYLRSKNCMFELVEIAENKQFTDRIFPVILSDAKIYDPIERLDYVEFWEQEKKKLEERMRKLTDLSNLRGIHEELDNYDRFRDRISELTTTLKNMNVLTPAMHQEADFNRISTAIEKRLKESGGSVVIDTLDLEYFEPRMISIREGPFHMGSPKGSGAPAYEIWGDEVNLPKYFIGECPVKNSEYQEFISQTGKLVPRIMGWEGQNFPAGQEDAPVLGVTFFEAIQYCEWLSKVTKHKYTLPNEAQWEKACQGASGVSQPMGHILEWTCTLWGEKRLEPDLKYRYPWKSDDGRNELKISRPLRRVVRGYVGADETGTRRITARCGRAPDDPGSGDVRHGFRVVRI